MSMLNKKGDVFTLLGIQEDVEEKISQNEGRDCWDYGKEISSEIRKKGGIIPHYSHNEYDSIVQKGQNDE